MGYIKFPSNTITTYSKEERRFDFKNNYGYNKSANF